MTVSEVDETGHVLITVVTSNRPDPVNHPPLDHLVHFPLCDYNHETVPTEERGDSRRIRSTTRRSILSARQLLVDPYLAASDLRRFAMVCQSDSREDLVDVSQPNRPS